MCEYKQYCQCYDCDGYPEECELVYCLHARIDKMFFDTYINKINEKDDVK